MTHRQFHRNALVHTEAMGYTSNDRMPLFGTLSGSQGFTTTWCALLNGAALYPFPVIVKGITGLADWVISNDITVYVSSASIFRSLAKILDDDFRFAGVRAVRLASEPVTAEDFGLFQKHFTEQCVFVHTLSCSETGNIAAWRRSWHDIVPSGVLPVGVPSKGEEVLLLDEEGRPVASGQVGEIVVKSRYVAAGYWRNPELTAERFTGEVDSTGTRLVRTGDLGRINAAGMLEVCGRRDDRVKVRGNRIELSEIVEALHRLQGIERAVVEAVPQAGREPILVGFVVVRGEHPWAAPELRRALRVVLPDHMVPSEFVILERFPLTLSGKIDRQKLREDHSSARQQKSGRQPTTEMEALLAGIWAKVFGLTDISRSDDFFELGGDSLMAAVAAAEVHAAVGVELDLKDFSDHPGLAELAGVIDEYRLAGDAQMAPLRRASRDQPLPLSFWQQRIWNFSQTPEHSAGYTVVSAFRILGPFDIDVFRACMDFLVRRHEILRTTFALIGNQPIQVIEAPAPVSLEYLDLSGGPDPEEEVELIRKKEAGSAFDLTRGPLLRHMLCRMSESEHRLLRVGHHILFDGRSWEIYFEELARLYEARVRGLPPPLPEVAPLQYGDYAVWQRQVFSPTDRRYQEAIAWWTKALSGAPPAVELPFARAKTKEGVVPADGLVKWGADHEVSQRLNRVASGRGLTRSMARLAAFAALLGDETGDQDVIIGMYVSNRDRLALHSMIGFFSNLATFRFRFDRTKSFAQWLSIVRDVVVDVEAHSAIPYDTLRDELQRQGVRMPEIKVIFQSSRAHRAIEFAGLKLMWLYPPLERISWGFTLNADEQNDDEGCRAYFDPRIYDGVGVRRFLGRYQRLLDAASRQPDATLRTLLAIT
jgi:non-ribosomal peptide synthetase component F